MKSRKFRGDASLNAILDTIGRKLLQFRIRKGYSSHAAFARKYKLPRIQYWRMEKGRANITLKSLHRVLSIHQVSMDDFFRKIITDKKKKDKAA